MRRGVFPAARACAVAPVNRPVRIQEERAPGLVMVELEQTQIDVIDRNDAHADELLLERFQLIAPTNRLFVKVLGGRSGHAAKQDEQWPARGLRLGGPLFQVVVNPVVSDGRVFEASLQIRLGMKPQARRKNRPKYQRNGESVAHSLDLPKLSG